MADQNRPTTDDQAIGAKHPAILANSCGKTVALSWVLFAAAVGGCLFTTYGFLAIGYRFETMPESPRKDLFVAWGIVAAVASLGLVPGTLSLAIFSIFKQIRWRMLAVAGLLIAIPPAVMISIFFAPM